MAISTFYYWYKDILIAKKLYSVVGIMAVLIVVELGTLYFAVNTLSSVRAFVGAEGLWSKAQKDAVYSLRKYYRTGNEISYKEFYNFMKVPLGDQKTLFQLLNKNPDLGIAKQGLLEGGNHPEDIDGMIKLFTRFNNISYIKKSLNIWREADSVISKLRPIAQKLNIEINSTAPSQSNLNTIVDELDPINEKLTALENEFSSTLGEGARWLENSILKLLFAIALTVGFTGLILTYFVVRGITRGLNEITNASKSIAEKDFDAKAKVFSNDEIGQLATSFNMMTQELSSNIKKRIEADQELVNKDIFIKENEKRVIDIMDALIKTTQLDFSEKLIVSDKRDELDAIAVGLNTMSEELEFHLHELKLSEEKLNAAQRLAKIGNWDMDMATRKVQWSNEMYNIYGYGDQRSEMCYEKAMERVLPEDVVRINERIKLNIQQALQAFAERKQLEFERPPASYTLVLPDGSRKVVEGIGKLILNESGQIIKMVGTVQDIDEQYKAEQKLNKYNVELEIRNKEIEQFA